MAHLSTTLTSDFCVEALQEALTRFGLPQIFDTEGSQFTAAVFTEVLKAHAVAISMDGKGRAGSTTCFVEWLWRSVKYEEVYLQPRYRGTGAQIDFGIYRESLLSGSASSRAVRAT